MALKINKIYTVGLILIHCKCHIVDIGLVILSLVKISQIVQTLLHTDRQQNLWKVCRICSKQTFQNLGRSEMDTKRNTTPISVHVNRTELDWPNTCLPCSSCPDAPAPCDWDTYNSAEPNYHVLTGALVGGPDSHDNYVGSRKETIRNMVSCDCNAAFQSAVATLVDLKL